MIIGFLKALYILDTTRKHEVLIIPVPPDATQQEALSILRKLKVCTQNDFFSLCLENHDDILRMDLYVYICKLFIYVDLIMMEYVGLLDLPLTNL